VDENVSVDRLISHVDTVAWAVYTMNVALPYTEKDVIAQPIHVHLSKGKSGGTEGGVDMWLEDLTTLVVFACFSASVMALFTKPKPARPLPDSRLLWILAYATPALAIPLARFTRQIQPVDYAYYRLAAATPPSISLDAVLNGRAVAIWLLAGLTKIYQPILPSAEAFTWGYELLCWLLICLTAFSTWALAEALYPAQHGLCLYAGVLAVFSPTIVVAMYTGLLAAWLGYCLMLLTLAAYLKAIIPTPSYSLSSWSKCFLWLVASWPLALATMAAHKYMALMLVAILGIYAFFHCANRPAALLAAATVIVLFMPALPAAMPYLQANLGPLISNAGRQIGFLGGPVAAPWLYAMGLMGILASGCSPLACWLTLTAPMLICFSPVFWRFYAFFPWPILMATAASWLNRALHTSHIHWLTYGLCAVYTVAWLVILEV
jgi:hypothetical protein